MAENIVLGDQRDRGLVLDREALEASVEVLGERYGLAVDPRAQHLAALGRRAAARRDPQGAAPRRARPDPRRAHRGAHAAGGRARCSPPCARWRPRAGRSSSSRTSCTRCSTVSDRVTVLRGGRVVATVETRGRRRRMPSRALMVGREVETGRRQPSARRRSGERRAGGSTTCSAEGDRGAARAARRLARRCAAGEIVGDRRRGGQRAARAGRGDHRHARSDRRPSVASSGSDAARRRSARCDRARRRTRARGPARHRRRAEPLDRVEPRAQGLPRPGRARGAVPAPRPHRAAAPSTDRALRRARRRARHARPRSSRAATCRRSCSAREFAGEPRVLVAASPTRGLDVGAIEAVHELLRAAAADGVACC